MHLPPPLHGASISNLNVANSTLINTSFDVLIVNLQFAKTLQELREFTFLKILKAIKFGLIIIRKAITFKPDLIYFTLSPNGFAFYRDAFYVLILKLFKLQIVFHLHGKGIKKATEVSSFQKKSLQGCF